MKILHLITRLNRGGTANWLKNLTDLKGETSITTIIAAGLLPNTEVEDSYFHELGYKKLRFLQKNISLKMDLLAFFEIRSLLRFEKPDLLNTHTSKAGFLGRLAAASLIGNRPKVIHTYHGHLLYGYFNKVQSFIFTKFETFLSLITDGFIVSGSRVKNELISAGVGRNKIWMKINPGVNLDFQVERSVSRDILHLDINTFLVGWMGRLESIKRPNLVIEIAKKIPEITFLIAGTGSLQNNLLQISTSNVKFVEWVSPSEFWPACDVALSTSSNEAQPFALIEAGLAGLPLIAFDVGGIDEVISDGVNGFLCNSTSEIIEKIHHFRDNPVDLEKFGKESKLKLKESYSLETFQNKHLSFYKTQIHI